MADSSPEGLLNKNYGHTSNILQNSSSSKPRSHSEDVGDIKLSKAHTTGAISFVAPQKRSRAVSEALVDNGGIPRLNSIDSFFPGLKYGSRTPRSSVSMWTSVTGNLKIAINEGSDFSGRGKFEPYAMILTDDGMKKFVKRAKTKTQKKSNNPTWNQEFTIPLLNTTQLQLRIKGQDKLAKEELWAYGTIALGPFADNKVHDHTVLLYPQGKCTIQMKIEGSTSQTPPDLAVPKGGLPVFGQLIEATCSREGSIIPLVVVSCVEDIESRKTGMEEEGLYRLSGLQTTILNLKDKFDQLEPVNLKEETKDVHDVTGLLKLYFRELPNPIFPYDSYHDFIAASSLEDPQEISEQFRVLLQKLPEFNRFTIMYLMTHLKNVTGYSKQNKMTNINLAVCFGPTLLRNPDLMPSASAEKNVVQKMLEVWPIEGLSVTNEDAEAEAEAGNYQTKSHSLAPSLIEEEDDWFTEDEILKAFDMNESRDGQNEEILQTFRDSVCLRKFSHC